MAILRPVVMFRDNDVTLVLHRCFRGPDFPLFHKSNRMAPGENWENGFDGFNGFNGFGKKHFLCYIWRKALTIKKSIWRESAKNFKNLKNFKILLKESFLVSFSFLYEVIALTFFF